MSIPPITSQSIFSTASTSAASTAAAAFDPQESDSDDPAAALNSLTGSSTASLDTQTLQALLDLTQGSGAQSQTQGAKPHHHHHHGGAPQQQPGFQHHAGGRSAG